MFAGVSAIATAAGRTARLATFAALSAVLLAACAAPEPPPPLPPRADIPHGQGRLWQVDGDGIETSYVFGTMHVSDPRVLALPHAIWEAFNKTEIAAFEIALAPGEERMRLDEDRVTLPEGTTTRSLVGARAWGQLVSVYKGKGYWKPRM